MTCNRPDLHEALAAYPFDDVSTATREALEAHLLTCDTCWGELQRLEAAVRVLRDEATATSPAMRADVIQVTGLSARSESAFAGHLGFVVSVGLLYGALAALALLIEVAYEWDQFSWAPPVSAAVGVGSAACWGVVAYWLADRVRQQRRGSLAGALLVMTMWGIAVGGPVALWLPERALVQASFQTWLAPMAWMKDLLQATLVPLAAAFALHSVAGLQGALWNGRSKSVVDLLSGHPLAIAPRGIVVVPSRLLATICVGVALWLCLSTTYLFQHLIHGPGWVLYFTLNVLRLVLLAGGLLTVAIWYARTLDELKREALAVSLLRDDAVH